MKTYFINKINNKEVNLVVNSLKELASSAIANCTGDLGRIYVHCTHVCTANGCDEQNVEYIVNENNRKRTISTKRI